MKKKIISAGIKAATKAYKKAAAAKKVAKKIPAKKSVTKKAVAKKTANVKLTKTQLKQMQDLHKSAKAGVAKRTAKAKAKATNVLKPKTNAFKGVQSAGAVKNAPVRAARAARGNKILAGTAGALGAAVVYNKNKSSSRAAASPAAVAPKKKPTNVVMPRKAAPKKAAPKKAAPKAKAKPRAASFTPTAKRTPLSVSKGKKKVGYVKSNRSGRGGLRTRGR